MLSARAGSMFSNSTFQLCVYHASCRMGGISGSKLKRAAHGHAHIASSSWTSMYNSWTGVSRSESALLNIHGLWSSRIECAWGKQHRTLQWRHDERHGVSNHRPPDCLLDCLFRRRSKKTSKLRVTGLCEGKSLVIGEFPSQMASNAEKASIWRRLHEPELAQCRWDILLLLVETGQRRFRQSIVFCFVFSVIFEDTGWICFYISFPFVM